MEEQKTTPVVNHNMDIGGLVVEDCAAYDKLTEQELLNKTKKNLCQFYKALYELKKQQKEEDGGEDGEILEYTRSAFAVRLPDPTIVLPR